MLHSPGLQVQFARQEKRGVYEERPQKRGCYLLYCTRTKMRNTVRAVQNELSRSWVRVSAYCGQQLIFLIERVEGAHVILIQFSGPFFCAWMPINQWRFQLWYFRYEVPGGVFFFYVRSLFCVSYTFCEGDLAVTVTGYKTCLINLFTTLR